MLTLRLNDSAQLKVLTTTKQYKRTSSQEFSHLYRKKIYKTMTSAEQIKKELPSKLRAWFQGQTKWKSLIEIANQLGINKHTMSDYFNGRNYPKGENLKKLAEITQLPILLQIPQNDTGKKQVQKKNEVPQSDNSTLNNANEVYQKLTELNTLLEHFKKGTAKEREVLRQTIPPMQIGYITSLLKALYNEDEFQQWIFFSEYKMNK